MITLHAETQLWNYLDAAIANNLSLKYIGGLFTI